MRVVFRQCFTREAKAMIVAELVRRDLLNGEVKVVDCTLYLKTPQGVVFEVCMIPVREIFRIEEIPALLLLQELGFPVKLVNATFQEITEIRQSAFIPL